MDVVIRENVKCDVEMNIVPAPNITNRSIAKKLYNVFRTKGMFIRLEEPIKIVSVEDGILRFSFVEHNEIDVQVSDIESALKDTIEKYIPEIKAISKLTITPWNNKRMTEIQQKICPVCGARMVVRGGRNGQFWGCGNYPKCTKTERI